MLSQLTDPRAVEQAITEFDQLGRQAFLEKYGFREAQRYFVSYQGHDYDSKAIVGAAYGFQHPDRKALSPNEFSGGDATVRSTLERLGFSVVNRSADRLASTFEEVCEQLQLRENGAPEFDKVRLTQLINTYLPERLRPSFSHRAQVKGSAGMGTLADVPWVGLFDLEGPASAQHGFYLVYLFAKDGSGVFLGLEHGTESVGDEQILVKRSVDLRNAVGRQDGLLTRIDLRSQAARPRKYEAATAYASYYEQGAWPGDETLKADLERMLDLVDLARSSGLSWNEAEDEPLHLVLKWQTGEAGAVDRHRELAERHGSAWWGRIAPTRTSSVPGGKLARLAAQIKAGTKNHAYFYRLGDLWRATVHEVTVDPPGPEDTRFPSHYRPDHCNLFVRVSEFEQLEPSWLLEHAVLADQPDAEAGLLAAALADQRSPLFIFELGRPPTPAFEDKPQDAAEATALDVLGVTLADVCADISTKLRESRLVYGSRHDALVRIAVVSLATKRFLLLTGLSGSGKTRLAIAVGDWLGPDRVAVIPVRPDWTGPDALLGYENGLSEAIDGRHAWVVPAALRFILAAARDPGNPYMLILDEMNLAHVERYFADVLSGMESDKEVIPNLALAAKEWRAQQPEKIPFPKNLFVVGTVNIDETTYMFSPKVLDRANTLEFRVVTDDLPDGPSPAKHTDTGDAPLVKRFLYAATSVADDDWGGRSQMAGWLKSLHSLLSRHDREFGHRVFFEALRFGALLSEAGEPSSLTALDLQVLQKILPRFHGSIRQIGDALNALGAFCFHGPEAKAPTAFDPCSPPQGDPVLPLSFDKITRMSKRLRANQFVAFAE